MALFLPQPVIVKNTFIVVQEDESQPSRRRRSVPPSLRFSATAPRLKEDDDKASVSTADRSELSKSTAETAPSVPSAQSGRIKLTSKAEAWEPGAPPQDPLFQEFQQEASQIIMTAQAALQADGRASCVQAMTAWEGMCLRIFVPGGCEDILEVAKAALLSAADLSTSTYIMGYGGNPFTTQLGGFTATMGAMRDESKACWEMYRYGICRRSCHCRWQHPPFLTSITVSVEVADAVYGMTSEMCWSPMA